MTLLRAQFIQFLFTLATLLVENCQFIRQTALARPIQGDFRLCQLWRLGQHFFRHDQFAAFDFGSQAGKGRLFAKLFGPGFLDIGGEPGVVQAQ